MLLNHQRSSLLSTVKLGRHALLVAYIQHNPLPSLVTPLGAQRVVLDNQQALDVRCHQLPQKQNQTQKSRQLATCASIASHSLNKRSIDTHRFCINPTRTSNRHSVDIGIYKHYRPRPALCHSRGAAAYFDQIPNARLLALHKQTNWRKVVCASRGIVPIN